jgi:putative NIF3 family GTP cyclohydrolase 1 type 2
MKCREITEIIERLCPLDSALTWDNPGLITGDMDAEVHNIMVALDATDEVIDAAIAQHTDMLITHQRLIQRI